MGFISSEIIAEIRERTDIVQIIGEHVRLIPAGNNYKALCPLHKEKTPSFNVVPSKQIFHCFGCGKGGDVFAFLMELEHMTFPETVRFLAQRCGVAIPQDSQDQSDPKLDVYNILDRAAVFFRTRLLETTAGKKVRTYLSKRKINTETIEKFRLGYAPNSWDDLLNYFGKNHETMQLLERAGLIKPRNSGSGFYDIFRNRLMIPIIDNHGRVVGFGGRVIDPEDEPKYLNSPESEVFNKRKLLFNFRQALPFIRRLNQAVVVEGYLDVISLAQHGIGNVVATLGTAITPDQIHMLARNCETVFLSYDADAAGQRATLRAVSLQKDSPIDARILAFPDSDDDPDSFVIREGSERFKELLEKAMDIYTFIIENRTRGLKPPLEISVKEKLIKEFRELVPVIHSPIARSEVIKKISKLLDMDPNILDREFSKGAANRRENQRKIRNFVSPTLDASIQRQEWVLKHLLEVPQELERVRALLGPDDFSDPRLKKIFEAISFQQQAAGGSLKPAEILAALDDHELVSRLSQLITSLEDRPPEPFMDCVKGLLKTRLESELKKLQTGIRDAEKQGDDKQLALLGMEQTEIKRKIDLLY